MRWNPSTFTVTEEPLEVVCESSTTFDELRTLIANAVQLGDDEHGSTDIAHIGVTKRGWRMDSVLDVPGLAWDADREDPDKMDAYGRAATSDIGFISDGDVFLYQDNREELKELTEEERKKLKTESRAKAKVGASQETVRMKYLRQNDTVRPWADHSTSFSPAFRNTSWLMTSVAVRFC